MRESFPDDDVKDGPTTASFLSSLSGPFHLIAVFPIGNAIFPKQCLNSAILPSWERDYDADCHRHRGSQLQ